MPLPDPDPAGEAAKLRALIEASPLGLSYVEGGCITLASRVVEEVTGYRAEELLGQSPRLLYFSDEEHEAARREIQEQLSRSGKCRLEVRLRHRAGNEIWARLSCRPLDAARPEAGFCLIAEDITETRRNTVELETLLKATPMAIACVVDRRYVWTNPAFEALTGLSSDELKGQSTRIAYESDEAFEAFGRAHYPAIRAGETIRAEVTLLAKGGRRMLCEIFGRALEPAHPERGAIFLYHDITEQHRLRKEARERATRIRLLLDSTAEGIYGLDADGTCILCNRTCLRMLGYADESDLIGRKIHDLIHHTRPDSTPYPLAECKAYAAFRRGEPMHVDDEVFWRADGTPVPVEYWSYPMLDEGTVVGSVVTFLDISERRAAEAALRAGKQRLRALIDSIPDMAWLKDQEGRFLAVNMPLAKYCRRPAEEIVGRLDAEVFPAAIARRYRADDEKVMETRETIRFDESYTGGEGRSRWLEVIKVPMFDEDGRVVGTAGIARDITDRRGMESRIQAQAEKLAEQNASLLRANRTKTDFLSTMQHELKTPLNAIIGFSELLAQGIPQPLPPEQQAFAQDVLDAGRHLLELINDILTYTRGESGELALRLEPFDAQAFLHGCVEAFRKEAEAKSIGLTLSVAAECGTFSADRQYLRKIVDNLLSNAIKFTPAGGRVAVTAQVVTARKCGKTVCDHAGQASCQRCLQIAVADTGIGIAEKDIYRVFQPFLQLESGLTRPAGGTGLGLVLSRRLAELHGGGLDFESSRGKGSTFTLTLPWQPARTVEQEEKQP
jgi:PAS domain S-box-containing protein